MTTLHPVWFSPYTNICMFEGKMLFMHTSFFTVTVRRRVQVIRSQCSMESTVKQMTTMLTKTFMPFINMNTYVGILLHQPDTGADI